MKKERKKEREREREKERKKERKKERTHTGVLFGDPSSDFVLHSKLFDTLSMTSFRDIWTYFSVRGSDIGKGDCDGDTPLHHAAFAEMFSAVECLLRYKADVDAQNTSGRTYFLEQDSLHFVLPTRKKDMGQFVFDVCDGSPSPPVRKEKTLESVNVGITPLTPEVPQNNKKQSKKSKQNETNVHSNVFSFQRFLFLNLMNLKGVDIIGNPLSANLGGRVRGAWGV
eukprot:1943630-Amphidinium_carterae.1